MFKPGYPHAWNGKGGRPKRPIKFKLMAVVTGVPRRDGDRLPGARERELLSSPAPSVLPLGLGDADGDSSPSHVSSTSSCEVESVPAPQPPKYIRVTLRNGTGDDDPGEIREGLYSVEAGVLVLTDLLGEVLASEMLKGQDPSELARRLLREGADDSSFNAPLRYGPLSVA